MVDSGQKILVQEYGDIVRRFGSYLSFEIDFLNDNAVLPAEHYGLFLKRIIRIIADFSKKPISSLRILDIGSYEGLFSVGLAMLGAEVLGVEGRASNIAKAEFLKKIYGVHNVTFIRDDVRNITTEKYGRFDIVIAAGILYHLEAEGVWGLSKNIFETCDDFAIVDTQIALSRRTKYELGGRIYHGLDYEEPSATMSEIEKNILNPQDGIGNIKSFWPTKVSLCNMLTDAGFTSVADIIAPSVDEVRGAYDRITLVGRKGVRAIPSTVASFDVPPLKEIIGEQIMVQMVNCPGDIVESPSSIVGHDSV